MNQVQQLDSMPVSNGGISTCGCGCGAILEAAHGNRRYFENHRRRKLRTVAIRVPVEVVPKIKAVVLQQRARKCGVQRIPATLEPGRGIDRQVLRLAALWLKNRLAEQNAK